MVMNLVETRIQAVSDIESFIDTQIDSFLVEKKKPKFSFYKYLSSGNIDKKTIIKFINDTPLQDTYEEVRSAYYCEDSYLTEAYGHLKRNHLREFKEMLEEYIEDAHKYSGEKNVRSGKTISAEQQVAKVKYSKTCEVNGVIYNSIEPKELIGKRVACLYDHHREKLSVYYSTGFVVKGSTIINFDPNKSWMKKLRKPNEILDYIVDSSQIAINNLSGNLTTKPYPPTGRIGLNYIILKVF
jgi:hypothetical protein